MCVNHYFHNHWSIMAFCFIYYRNVHIKMLKSSLFCLPTAFFTFIPKKEDFSVISVSHSACHIQYVTVLILDIINTIELILGFFCGCGHGVSCSISAVDWSIPEVLLLNKQSVSEAHATLTCCASTSLQQKSHRLLTVRLHAALVQDTADNHSAQHLACYL